MDVVVKLSNPRLDCEDLTYDISVIEGKVPKEGGACSVFIDIIGLPFTPLPITVACFLASTRKGSRGLSSRALAAAAATSLAALWVA